MKDLQPFGTLAFYESRAAECTTEDEFKNMKKEVESKPRCFKELVNLCKSSTKAVTVFINKRKAAAKKAE